ncbi:MAG TPA: TonB family protein [Terriglobales bacterium]|nr:TonB family protein [Terriglobales bacterium]
MSLAADIFEDHEQWGGPLGASIAVHAALTLVVLGWAWVAMHRGAQAWGGPGAGSGAITVTAVSSIPLPAEQSTPNTNVLANPSKGLTQSPPKQAEKAPDDAIPIAGKSARRPKPAEQPSNPAPAQPQPVAPSNQVQYGQGGPANSVQFNMGSGTGGLTVEGSGDFQGIYDWYVQAMRRKIAQTWAFYQGGSGVPKGARVTVSFEIDRSGRPTKIGVAQPSGYAALDQSALQTLQRVDTFGPLPDSYRGSSVLVNFYFEAQ